MKPTCQRSKISRELRTYGANLIVTPQEDTLDLEIGGVNLKPPSDGAYLNEADLPKIKDQPRASHLWRQPDRYSSGRHARPRDRRRESEAAQRRRLPQ